MENKPMMKSYDKYLSYNKYIMDFFTNLVPIVSKGSYGNIFTNTDGHIVKVQTLKSGIHFDKIKKIYLNGDNQITETDALLSYPQKTILWGFRHKEGISMDSFNHEVKIQCKMAHKHLSPKIYNSGTFKIAKLHFCYIEMAKMDISLKSQMEIHGRLHVPMDIVNEKIKKLHKLGYSHGDLQPANICLNLNKSGDIIKCRIIDWFFTKKTRTQSDFDYDYGRLKTMSQGIKLQ